MIVHSTASLVPAASPDQSVRRGVWASSTRGRRANYTTGVEVLWWRFRTNRKALLCISGCNPISVLQSLTARCGGLHSSSILKRMGLHRGWAARVGRTVQYRQSHRILTHCDVSVVRYTTARIVREATVTEQV